MQVYVSKDGKQYGPFTVEQLRQYVQQGNFTTGDHACHDGKNWVTIAKVPGFAEATQPASTPSPKTPQQDQTLKEKPVEQQPASANASNSPAKKKKIILWSSIGGGATLLVAGLLIWILGGDEGGESVQDAQEEEARVVAPPDAKPAQVSKIDLDDPKTFKRIVAKAVKTSQIQKRGKKGEELLYRKNQPNPYTGWSKWMGGHGRIRNLIQWKDGKQNGLVVWLYKNNGQKERELNYKDGKKDGLMTWWYENGQKSSETNYKDDKFDGPFTRWYDLIGQKKEEGNYKGGKLMSVVAWKPNGERCPATNVVDGNGIWVHYNDKDGTVERRVTYREGELVSD